jgi:Transposase
LYDGPFCVLSIVDNRTHKRLLYEVLDHDPSHDDIRAFFRRFRAALDDRGLAVRGVTTDGSALYPVPIAEVFGPVPHQVCEFHVLKEITEAVLHAVAKVRKALAAAMPRLPRGRPSKRNRGLALRRQRAQERITALFQNRHLFVRRRLTAAEKKVLAQLGRGSRPLQALRDIMEEVYRLFDRRCRMETALGKLARLRRRVRRFRKLGKALNKLFSPNLEKALVFLDDKLLGATSNAVERGNRRHRQVQKRVYRVRTEPHIRGRIALDMLREAQAEGRQQTTGLLHEQRAREGQATL